MNPRYWFIIGLVLLAATLPFTIVNAQGPQGGGRAPAALPGTGFTYQGMLKTGGALVNANCDFQFGLWDAAAAAPQYGATQTVSSLAVTNGLFTTLLNFGIAAPNNVFTGTARYLQSAVRCPAGGGSYTALAPRQALTPAPYALALPGLYTQQKTSSPNIIGGYSGNIMTNTLFSDVFGATISGGGSSPAPNSVTDSFGTVGGGYSNQAGYVSTIGGGLYNTASGRSATIGGGDTNIASGESASVSGGYSNTASYIYATVGGGNANTSDSANSTVGGGSGNAAINSYATIGGGFSNSASGSMSVIGGGDTNTASGTGATVAGGYHNSASGNYSFAGGQRADTNNKAGAFVWADDIVATTLSAPADNSFIVRASGGITLYTNSAASVGVQVAPGSGSWSSVSDRNLKANFADVDSQAMLARVNALPIQTWNYSTQDPAVRHIGPMAQDFYAAFQVGEDERHIATVDEEGVALAAIQGLDEENVKLQAKSGKLEEESAKQRAIIEELRQQNAALEGRVAAIEQVVTENSAARTDPAAATAPGWMVGGLLLIGVVVWQNNRGVKR